ncbi:MAG: PEP-CTERM sorting domain-containing protein [Pseudomonadota bacterium]
MTKLFTRTAAIGTLALAAVLGAGPALAATSAFTLSGSTDGGPLAGLGFSGSFAFDDSALDAGFSGSIQLSSFMLSFAGQSYSLASADATPAALFEAGQFMGLDYADADSPDLAARPAVVFVSSLSGVLADAYMAYEGLGGQGGYGSYSISAVPEPGQWALLLAGLAGVAAVARRRAAHTTR